MCDYVEMIQRFIYEKHLSMINPVHRFIYFRIVATASKWTYFD